MPRAPQKRTLETRARLIAAAEAIIAEDGYEALRVEEVTARAGVAKGTFFAHFQDKDGLMDLLIGAEIDRRLDAIETAPPPETAEGVAAGLAPLLAFMTSERYVFDVIIRYSGAAARDEIGPIAMTFERQVKVIAAWLAAGGVEPGAHMAALSTNIEGAGVFGIDESRVFGFWDWVGGRYSVWSAIGLPLAIAIGAEGFRAFLAGARAMDDHFRTAPLAENLPVLLALAGIWRRNFLKMPTVALIPYDQRLEFFAAYVQQLDMESNGKRVTLSGDPVAAATGPIIWGEPGTNSQHSFFQLVHQGTDPIPVDFIAAKEAREDMGDHHALLLANCLAQSRALAFGRTEAEAREAMSGMDAAEIDRLAPHRTFPGDRPSTTILYRRLDPFALGRLIALYEHKVFVQGAIWGVNSYDQWGVELGKALANELIPVVKGDAEGTGLDGSTAGLVAALKGRG